jgi:uncharacterized phage-associated protein
MANSVLTIANFFIDKSQRDEKPIDPLKLQKLIYIAHGWSLAFTGEPLIRESFEAWKYGPVVPLLYQYFKDLRSAYIKSKANAPNEQIPLEACDLITQVWDKYKNLSATTLSSLTHEPGSAWSKTYDGQVGGFYSSNTIPNSLIREEFLARLPASEDGR